MLEEGVKAATVSGDPQPEVLLFPRGGRDESEGSQSSHYGADRVALLGQPQ